MNSEDIKIYRNYTLQRLSKDSCTLFLQNLARCNGHISSSFSLGGNLPDAAARYVSMFFCIYFIRQADLDKFHSLGTLTTEIEKVSVS